jgi:hypothetical protein
MDEVHRLLNEITRLGEEAEHLRSGRPARASRRPPPKK